MTTEMLTDERALLSWLALAQRENVRLPRLRSSARAPRHRDDWERTRTRRELGDQLIEMMRAAAVEGRDEA